MMEFDIIDEFQPVSKFLVFYKKTDLFNSTSIMAGYDFQRERQFYSGVFDESLRLKNFNNTIIALQNKKIEQITIKKD